MKDLVVTSEQVRFRTTLSRPGVLGHSVARGPQGVLVASKPFKEYRPRQAQRAPGRATGSEPPGRASLSGGPNPEAAAWNSGSLWDIGRNPLNKWP